MNDKNKKNEKGSSLNQVLQNKFYSYQKLNERKVWYSDAAIAYNSYRPKYPPSIVENATRSIRTGKRILEIGSGPGTVTTPLAEMGFEVRCIEPNLSFCDYVRRNTRRFGSLVTVEASSFEEANVEDDAYDAIVAATSIHWIPLDDAFAKCARALRNGGQLILLWNMVMNPANPTVMERIIELHHALPDDADAKDMFW